MRVPSIDHIGIIVENLERSVAMFERMFHLKSSGIKDMPDVGLRIAQLNGANISIELLQYSGEGESLAKKTMGVKPGINHLSIRVEDIKSSLEDLKGKGLRVIEGFPRQGSHGQVAFFEPDTTQGILLEVCEG
jgi:methylmalonyl-CoA/ethylmalonyl-CoA epimerase